MCLFFQDIIKKYHKRSIFNKIRPALLLNKSVLKKLTGIFLFAILLVTQVKGQLKPYGGPQLTGFKALLSTINGTFTYPENFTEVKPPNNEKLPFQYGLKMDDADLEIWFQVNSVRAEWQRFEANKQGADPDSSYTKVAADEALTMSGRNDYITRSIPPYILDRYNADEGRSYLLTLADLPATKHYQYALLIVLHKNHYGNMVVACLTNEKGPAFYRNVNQLKHCFRFNN